MEPPNWQLAEDIARELVDRETDVNEFQKAIVYARTEAAMPNGKVGEKFFSLLEIMTREGRYLARSGRTMDYYRDLREVCERHLRDFRTATGERGRELTRVLAWAARLMRYYKTEAGEVELADRERFPGRRPPSQPRELVTKPPPNLPPSGSSPPKRPTTPASRVESKRETVTIVMAAKGGKARVQTTRGEEIICDNLPSYPPTKAGDVCRADVTREGGKATKAIFKGWR